VEGSLRDISSRKAAEDKLRHRQPLFQRDRFLHQGRGRGALRHVGSRNLRPELHDKRDGRRGKSPTAVVRPAPF
jgi:hypothetical protein